jgi:hypothetical protein
LFNASWPLFYKRDSLLNASTQLLFKVTLPTSAGKEWTWTFKYSDAGYKIWVKSLT